MEIDVGGVDLANTALEEAKQKCIKELIKLQSNGDSDPKIAYIKADECVCDLLTKLGMEDVVMEYKKIHRWFG